MRGIYYKLPIDFKGIIEKKELIKISLEESIGQHIFMLMITSFGECKFDEHYGCEIWNIDFDLLKNDNELKTFITNSLKKSLVEYEKRIRIEDIQIGISQQNLGDFHKKRIKKKIVVQIRGTILETNRSLHFENYFFVSPLSY